MGKRKILVVIGYSITIIDNNKGIAKITLLFSNLRSLLLEKVED